MRARVGSLRWFAVLLFVSLGCFVLFPGGPALAQVHEWDVAARGQGDVAPAGPPNGGFETGDLTGWRTDYNWSGGQGAAPGHIWEVKVGPEYAHSGKFGCRVDNANNPSWSGAWLISSDFTDTSAGYSMWLKLAGGCTTYWSGVVVGIADVASGKEIRYEGNVSGEAWHHGHTVDGYFKLTPGEWQECRFDFGKDFQAKYGAAPGSLRRIYVSAYQDTDSCAVYVDDIRGYGGTQEGQLVTVEGILQPGVEYRFRLNRYVLLPYPGYESEYKKLDNYLAQQVRVAGYAYPGEFTLGGEGVVLKVTKVEPVGAPPPVSGTVIVDDPSFVRLTAVPNPDHHLMWATDYVLEVRAMDPGKPVEVSYLVTDSNGTPSSPTTGVENRENNFIAGWEHGGQYYFHTEVGGWAKPEFKANPQYFPLPHYRTCLLMLARYGKVYVIFLRENDGQLTYSVLQGGPFTGLDVPGLGKVTRQGNRFEVHSYGNPVEVGLWARGRYLHDEVAGWARPEYRENPKYYDIPHYGMFMFVIARYEKMGLIIGNENDGQLGAVVLTGSQEWKGEAVPDLCTLIPVHLRCGEGVRCPNSWPAVEVKATGGDPVEVSHFAFDNTCWQWEVNGRAKPEFAPNPQVFALKHYMPGFLMVSRYGKASIFFYNENDGQLGVLPVGAAISSPAPPAPPPGSTVAVFRLGMNFYEAGGQRISMDAAPYEKDGRTYVPVRYLANALGVRDQDIAWDPSAQKVTLKKGDITLCLMVGSTEVVKTDAAASARNFIPMDVAPEIVGGRVCLPARYVAEAFGYGVTWEEETRSVLVTGTAPQEGAVRTATSAGNKAPGEALITFHPHTPLDLIEGTAGFQEGFAGGQQFWLLPVDTAVWGYRVYIQGEPYDTSSTSAWKKAPGETGVYYQDYPAQYKRPWGSNLYRQRDPQELTLSGLVAGARYQVWVVPLCVTKKAGNWNVDKYGKVYRLGFTAADSAEVSGVVFVWAYKDSNEWGTVDKACLTWGEAEREKGYYVSGPAVIDSLDYYYVTAVRSGGGGGSSHGWMQ